MSIDPKFIAASDLELYLVDKTTGLPLADGTVTFYSDESRSTLKPIYTISGNPPNYIFVQLPNPSTLSAVGTFQDASNNNVIPYYYPYNAEGEVERYYIVVKDSGGVVQFTREAWPPNIPGSSSADSANFVNYIPNGQFLAHTDIPADPINNIPAGQITEAVTEIAQGGWFFVRPEGSTAVDNVQFFRYGEYVDNPASSPRYAVQLVCSSPDGTNMFKDLRVRFYDVNTFSSDTDQYTFGFTGVTFESGDFQATLDVIKYFGTGGSPSPTVVTTIHNFLITSTERAFQVSFVFGANDGYGIGTNNDDYVELALSVPTNISLGYQFTDFFMFAGDIADVVYPEQTTADTMARSFTLPVPNPDGSDLYLPPMTSRTGFVYDYSSIGRIESLMYEFPDSLSTTTNLMLADGSQYLTAGYSPLGIPFSRLWNQVIWDPNILLPKFGTGTQFVTTYKEEGNDASVVFFTNTFGISVPPTDGAISTGFTFDEMYPISASGYGFRTYQQLNATLAVSTTEGFVTAPTAGTSGFTVEVIRNTSAVNTFFMFTVTASAAAGLSGKYFTFHSNPGDTSYYVWFTVDGVGADPAPGGTGIKVELVSTQTSTDVTCAITNVLAGHEGSIITVVDGSSVVAGSYFTFTTPGANNYFVWYTVDEVGTKPVASGYGIQVNVLSSDTSEEVCIKTIEQINSTYFAVPNLQGMFLRGYDPDMIWDLAAIDRASVVPLYLGNMLGNLELDQVVSHSHTIPNKLFLNNVNQDGPSIYYNNPNLTTPTGYTGGVETNPVNMTVNFAIRY